MALEKRQRWKLRRNCTRWLKLWIIQRPSQWEFPFLRFSLDELISFVEQPTGVIDQWCGIHRRDRGQRRPLMARILWLCTCFRFDATVFDHSSLSSTRGTVDHRTPERWVWSFRRVLSCVMYKDDEWYIWRFPPPEAPWTSRYFFSICKRISGRCSSCPDGLGCHGSQQGLHEGCKGVKPLLNWEKVTVASTRQLKVTSQLGLPSVDVELYCFLTITLLLSAGLAM